MKRACLRASLRRTGHRRTVATAAAYKQPPHVSGNGDSEQTVPRPSPSKWARPQAANPGNAHLGSSGAWSTASKWVAPPPAQPIAAGKWAPPPPARTATSSSTVQTSASSSAERWTTPPPVQHAAPSITRNRVSVTPISVGSWAPPPPAHNAGASASTSTQPTRVQRGMPSKWATNEQPGQPSWTSRAQPARPNAGQNSDVGQARTAPRERRAPDARLDRGPAPHQVPSSGARQQAGPFADAGKQSFTDLLPGKSIALSPQQGVARDMARSKQARSQFKTRGSLRDRLGEVAATESHPRGTQGAPASKKTKAREPKAVPVDIFIPSMCSVGNLARLLNVRLERLQRKMVESGMAEESSYDHVLTADYAALLAGEFNRNPIVNDEAAFDLYPPPPASDPSKLPARPPIVTIMGHVDHGKTTLLDTLRSASVAKGEAGGITQHIGAFSVPVPSLSVSGAATAGGPKSITFLDTPGHAAFSAMRARGARVTDIVVLVVAADDGVMPQTKEVIELIKQDEGKIGVVVAINKVDKPQADVDKVQKALLAEGIQLEVFGGDIPAVEVSGLTGKGLDQLVETISALSELQDLRAERDGTVHGHVVESRVERGLGAVATVLIQRGCLKPGMHLVCGRTQAKVRVMKDSTGKIVKAAYPGDAITVSGWKEVPSAGDEAISGSDGDIKRALANRLRKAEQDAAFLDLEVINASRRAERGKREAEEVAAVAAAEAGQHGLRPQREHSVEADGPKELRIVIKGDVSGSVEAVAGALQGIGNNLAVVKIVSTGVGDVTESDVQMAQSTEGVIVAFCVNVPRAVEIHATQKGVPICSSAIIYQLMDEIKQQVIALLPVVIEKRVTGEATVLQLFDIHLKAKQVMKVAGCRVMNGVIEKNKIARVIRDGEIIFEGAFETMRQMKKDVMEIRKGLECGLSVQGFDDFREGDQIQAYSTIEKPGQL